MPCAFIDNKYIVVVTSNSCIYIQKQNYKVTHNNYYSKQFMTAYMCRIHQMRTV